jgi:hypothetical protein
LLVALLLFVLIYNNISYITYPRTAELFHLL